MTKKLIPVSEWNKFHLWPTVKGLRSLIFYEQENGMSCCIFRVGRRVLIDEARFFKWIEAQNPKTGDRI